MKVVRLDHLVLTVRDIARTTDFYTRVCGMRKVEFGAGRHALHFGEQKINLHQAGAEIDPKSAHPTPGSGDLCFIVDTSIEDVVAHVAREGVAIEIGPVDRTGALGPMRSVYLRDPDQNLVELSSYGAA